MNSNLLFLTLLFLLSLINIRSCVHIVWYNLWRINKYTAENGKQYNFWEGKPPPTFPFTYNTRQKKCLVFETAEMTDSQKVYYFGVNDATNDYSSCSSEKSKFELIGNLNHWRNWMTSQGKIYYRYVDRDGKATDKWLNNENGVFWVFLDKPQTFTLTRVYYDEGFSRPFFHILDENNKCLTLEKVSTDNDWWRAVFKHCRKQCRDGNKQPHQCTNEWEWEWDTYQLWVIKPDGGIL